LTSFADLVFQREFVIDAVQLKQIDGLHAEPPQAELGLLP